MTRFLYSKIHALETNLIDLLKEVVFDLL